MISVNDVAELVATYELPSVETAEDHIYGPLKFTIQVFKKTHSKRFFPRVYKVEKIEVPPVYTESKPDLLAIATFEILAFDNTEDWSELSGESVDDVIRGVVNRINELLGCA